jgi:hypothetical protein
VHEGKKELVVRQQAPKYEMDFARLAREMADLLGTVVVDPDLRVGAAGLLDNDG